MRNEDLVFKKLYEHYELAQEIGNFPHTVDYNRINKELIRPVYVFPEGRFILINRTFEKFSFGYIPTRHP